MRLAAVSAALLAAFAAAPAFAQNQNEAAAALLSCASVKGDKARLKCFERALPALSAAFPEAAEIAATRAEEAREVAKEETRKDFGLSAAAARAGEPFEEKAFGAENLPQEAKADDEDDGEVDSIEAGVVDVGRSLTGRIIVFLDNGQVWRQIDGDTSSPYISKNLEGVTATVKRGVLSSYFVRISGTHAAFKARRVK